MNYYKEEHISFRLINLTKEQADELSTHIANSEIRPQKQRSDKYLVTHWMNPEQDYSRVEALIQKHGLSEKNYGFAIFYYTEYPTPVYAVPEFLRALFRRIGGQFEFRFEVVGGDEEDEDDTQQEGSAVSGPK